MKRIVVVGPRGAGKTVLSRALGRILQLDVIHLDCVLWRPGWIPLPPSDVESKQRELGAGGAWIMDGHYSASLDVRFELADTIILLDFPRVVCLWRMLRRHVQYRGRSRSDIARGCPQTLTWDSVRWNWTYPRTRRPIVLQKIRAYSPGRTVVILKSASEVRRFLEDVEEGHTQRPEGAGSCRPVADGSYLLLDVDRTAGA